MEAILFVAITQSMAEVAAQVLKEMGLNIRIDTTTPVKELVQAYPDVNIFISRGGRATEIHKETGKPVVSITTTIYDFLPPIHRLITKGVDTIAIVTNSNMIDATVQDLQIGSTQIFMRPWSSIKNLQHILQQIAQAGVMGVVGDGDGVKAAKCWDFMVESFNSGPETIKKAIEEAVVIAKAQEVERVRNELFRIIVNSSAEGIIAVNKNGLVTVCNPVAGQAFQLQETSVIGKYIGDIRPDDQLRNCLRGNSYEREGIKKIGDKLLAIKRIPIKLGDEVVGAVANIQDVTQLQQFEQAIRQKINKKGLLAKYHFENLIGSSVAMQAVKERVRQYALTDATVLLTGESGTGKERVTQSIHNLSNRKNGPFVAVNCAALPENLLESELFGYVEGAFTGAKKGGKQGLFELAHGGTIFLDEISEMPLFLQARLLRVLQEREVMRLGADNVIPIDVRIISASNQDLEKLIEIKKFRDDLYYRLNVLRLHLPPLRDRIDDIPALITSLLGRLHISRTKNIGITVEAIKLLQTYRWPGNIRELENVIERVALLATGSMIEEADLRRELLIAEKPPHQEATGDQLRVLERKQIEQVLLEEKYNYTRTARRLGINRTTLWRKIQLWELTK
ncbi:sigma 54-interacting transcriptional regulator [Pelosinus sp. sgz500959]|uniref:sigma 54-interacting transcriptional regulator n=1 Tax=Pelosinus sp. sgz500959 TaxID=3242472 RepID=UPI003670CC4C